MTGIWLSPLLIPEVGEINPRVKAWHLPQLCFLTWCLWVLAASSEKTRRNSLLFFFSFVVFVSYFHFCFIHKDSLKMKHFAEAPIDAQKEKHFLFKSAACLSCRLPGRPSPWVTAFRGRSTSPSSPSHGAAKGCVEPIWSEASAPRSAPASGQADPILLAPGRLGIQQASQTHHRGPFLFLFKETFWYDIFSLCGKCQHLWNGSKLFKFFIDWKD